MGSGSQHAAWALGLAFFVQVSFLDNFAGLWISWLVFLLGAVVPDIDSCSSKIHRWLLFPKLYGTRFKHWGHCHSLWAALVYAVMVSPFILLGMPEVPLFAACGYVLHLVVDEGYKSKNNKRHAFKVW